ncbi:FMN-binding protein [Aurantimicrobium photophilum]|uniref:FMN-binding domain protein n=1 Tax=Aurantimicrobium photophilum TaxID=1987356 RepID=A0A2Z3RZD7_9MICO|nr:FMN-binding protein [Aurantimicrobium photophilum]AWR22057.1 FMN-binding domain protein [Aurantimicrobium photophilum]
MRAGSAFLAGVGSAAIVAIGWQAGVGTLVSSLPQSQAAASGTTVGASSSSAASTPAASSDTSSSTPAETTAPVASGPADGTYDGAVINTRYGAQQVQVVISSGQISDVIVLQTQTADRKSEQISSRANPILREEVLSAQSAQVANVSGATYTSQSYMQSLQSALDAAGFTG